MADLPADPFRDQGALLSDLAEAQMLWDALREMSIERAVSAIRVLDAEDVRAMVIQSVFCERVRLRVDGDGCVIFDRDEAEES